MDEERDRMMREHGGVGQAAYAASETSFMHLNTDNCGNTNLDQLASLLIKPQSVKCEINFCDC